MNFFKDILKGKQDQVYKGLRVGMNEYCHLETSEDETTFITRDSGLATFIDVRGSLKIMEDKSLSSAIALIESRLSGILAQPGFAIDIVIRKDPKLSRRLIESQIKPLRNTAKRLSLDMGDILKEREDLLSKKIIFEEITLVIKTMPNAISPEILNQIIRDQTESTYKFNTSKKPGKMGQSPFLSAPDIVKTHSGFLQVFLHALSEFFETEPLSCRDALKRIRKYGYSDATSENWEPRMPGDKIPARLTQEGLNDYDSSHVLYPDISTQIFPETPMEVAGEKSMVRTGDTYTATMIGRMKPDAPVVFSRLNESIDLEIPWSINFHVETGHDSIMGVVGNQKTLATLFAITNTNNLLVKNAAEELIEMSNNGEVFASLQLTFSTWGRSVDEAKRNRTILTKAIQGWGRMDISGEYGDPIHAWVNTLPGVSRDYIATPFPTSIGDIFAVLPLNRPTSPWENGNILFRTMDSKIYPHETSSSKQTTWSYVVFALPGFGKSLYLSASNLSDILSPRNQEIPLISIIDIGYSSSAFVDTIRDSLPKDKKHLVQAHKLKMSREFAVNPFDTQLGNRTPLSSHREFLTNFISLTLTPASGADSVDRLTELVTILIDEMYDYFSDKKNPRHYTSGVDKKVDEALARHDISIDKESTWWEVTDLLFEAGLIHEAGLAQRHATPTLNDATLVLNSSTIIRDVFGSGKSGEDVIQFLNSMIVYAVRNYPIIALPSVFDIGTARVVSLDLAEVAKSGSNEAKKKTGMMYMLARQILCQNYYMDLDSISEMTSMPEQYTSHHRRRIERNMLQPKKVCMDELHRCGIGQKGLGALNYVQDQITADIREGRKYDVQTVLLSQRLDDFSEAMVDLGSNVLIFSKGMTEATTDQIFTTFKPSEDTMNAFMRDVTGPSKEGATLLYLGQVKGRKGRAEMTLRLTLGPTEIWGYSTTHEDRVLRRTMAGLIGASKGRSILARRFPAGTAKDYVIKFLEKSNNVEKPYVAMCKRIIQDVKNKN